MINKILKEQLEKLKFFSFVVNGKIENDINNIEQEFNNLEIGSIKIRFVKHNILDMKINDSCIIQIDSNTFENSFNLNEGIYFPSEKMFCKIIYIQKEMIFCEIFSDKRFEFLTHMLWIPTQHIIDLRKI